MSKVYKVGDKVTLKTEEQLLGSGWYECPVGDGEHSYTIFDNMDSPITVVKDSAYTIANETMHIFLGKEVTIATFDESDGTFEIKEDGSVNWEWWIGCIAEEA